MPQPRRPGAVTIPDVALAAGVSTATAGRALGNYGAVRESVRERVLAAAHDLGYQPNRLARSMITKQTDSLGLMIADIEDPFFARLTRGITDAARSEGFDVLVANSDDDLELERRAVRVFETKHVDGILITPTSADDVDHLRAVRGRGTPVVLMDRRVPGWDVDTVVVDNADAARHVVGRLLDAGHTKVALIAGGRLLDHGHPGGGTAGPRLAITATDRITGYRDAFTERSMMPDPHYLRCVEFDKDAARRETLALLVAPDPPTAIFAISSVLALGVVEAIREAGRRIPDDVSVVSFDDAEWTAVVDPPLTVVAQPLHEIGALATRILIRRIRGDESPPTTHTLDTTFRERVSTCAPRARSGTMDRSVLTIE
jgi:LacI family transcriptional regulator